MTPSSPLPRRLIQKPRARSSGRHQQGNGAQHHERGAPRQEQSPEFGGISRFSPRETLNIEMAAMALAEAKDIVKDEEGGYAGG
mmetsp:Transcript_19383/g.29450  ORF Transcript_19383/g.29450 Transcript_19383/m.29450 type:complete len:84 (+) Transcript_19383:1-252(+)